jgi:hypothetical protein
MAKRLKHGDNLDIFGRDYRIDHSLTSRELDRKFGKNQTVGIADPNDKTIYIATDIDDAEKSSTMLHEVIEVIKFIFDWEKKLPETDVLNLEKSLNYTFKNSGIPLWEIES